MSSCSGEAPPSRSAKHRLNTACSRSRPVSTDGVAPVPGVNRRGSGTVMTTNHIPAGRRRQQVEGWVEGVEAELSLNAVERQVEYQQLVSYPETG